LAVTTDGGVGAELLVQATQQVQMMSEIRMTAPTPPSAMPTITHFVKKVPVHQTTTTTTTTT